MTRDEWPQAKALVDAKREGFMKAFTTLKLFDTDKAAVFAAEQFPDPPRPIVPRVVSLTSKNGSRYNFRINPDTHDIEYQADTDERWYLWLKTKMVGMVVDLANNPTEPDPDPDFNGA